jgi:hypothetical protein
MAMCSSCDTIWRREDDVLFEFLHLLFGSLRKTDIYSPLHSQESVSCFFQTLCQLVLVVSDRLR